MSKPLAAPPDVIRFVPRSGDHDDCAVAAIVLACGVTYEMALVACLKMEPNVLNGGMWWRNLRLAVIWLKFKTKTIPHKSVNVHDEDVSGILELRGIHQGAKLHHFVYLWGGRIIDTSPILELWDDPEMYLNHYGYRVVRLLQVMRHE